MNNYYFKIVLFSCFLHIFQILSFGPFIGWGLEPVYLTHVTHTVIAALIIIYYNKIKCIVINKLLLY
jgi:hypothetical protein